MGDWPPTRSLTIGMVVQMAEHRVFGLLDFQWPVALERTSPAAVTEATRRRSAAGRPGLDPQSAVANGRGREGRESGGGDEGRGDGMKEEDGRVQLRLDEF